MISKTNLELIKKVIENNYNALLLTTLGNSALTLEELETLEAAGIDCSNVDSLISLVYYQNVLHEATDKKAPVTIEAAKEAQASKPEKPANLVAEEHLNANAAAAVRKLKADVQQQFEALLRESNILERNAALSGDAISDIMREGSVAKIKQHLRDLAGTAELDFGRIAVTETANAIGLGSVDRIVEMAGDKDLDDVYVYRISVRDAALCSACRQFYVDSDGTPAIYRISTLLGNGSNYGLRRVDWKPVAGVTHPNDRETGCIEVRPGWKVNAGGSLEYIGRTDWHEYIARKIRS